MIALSFTSLSKLSAKVKKALAVWKKAGFPLLSRQPRKTTNAWQGKSPAKRD